MPPREGIQLSALYLERVGTRMWLSRKRMSGMVVIVVFQVRRLYMFGVDGGEGRKLGSSPQALGVEELAN